MILTDQQERSLSILDSSKLKDLLACPRYFFLRHVLGWTSDVPSIHLQAGTAWHAAQEVLLSALQKHGEYTIESLQDAKTVLISEYNKIPNPPDNGPKTCENLLLALDQYFSHYVQYDRFKVEKIEIAGCLPVQKNRLLYFKIDCIAEDTFGPFVLEHKTASRADTSTWPMTIQVGTYLHFLNLYYGKTGGVKINLAILRPPPRFKKDGTPYANASEGNAFMRVPINKTPSQMLAWLSTVNHFLDYLEWNLSTLREDTEESQIMRSFPCNPTSCGNYGGCPYLDYCIAWPNPLQNSKEAPIGMRVEHWDPTQIPVRETINVSAL